MPVQLVGFVENDQILKHLLECHAVVLLSDHEGLGLSLLEGMASGVVPIGLRGAPGVTEFVVDGLTGLLVGELRFGGCGKVRRFGSDWRAQPKPKWKLTTPKKYAPLAGKSFSTNS